MRLKFSETPEMAVILGTLECPVCYELIWPPKKIFQCSNGHIICEVCITNAAFDQVLNSLGFFTPYFLFGNARVSLYYSLASF